MRLEHPLIDALPSIDNARDRLLAKIFEHRKEAEIETNDEDFELLYTYTLVTGQISNEIREVLGTIEELFGTLDEGSFKLD